MKAVRLPSLLWTGEIFLQACGLVMSPIIFLLEELVIDVSAAV